MFEGRRVGRGILALGLAAVCWLPVALLATGPVSAGEPSKPAVGATEAPAASQPAPVETKIVALGVDLSVDARTGRLRPPTQEQLATLRQAFQKLMTPPTEEPKPTRHANGAESLPVGLWQFGAGFAFVDPEAGLQVGCVEGADNLNKLMESKAALEQGKAEVE